MNPPSLYTASLSNINPDLGRDYVIDKLAEAGLGETWKQGVGATDEIILFTSPKDIAESRTNIVIRRVLDAINAESGDRFLDTVIFEVKVSNGKHQHNRG